MSIRQINECFTKRYLTEGKNLDKTWEQYKEKLLKAPYISSEEMAHGMFQNIVEIDPTFKEGNGTTGDYGIWLLNRFLAGDNIIGNESAIKELLNTFIQKKSNLENKDINSYHSVDELSNALDNTQLSKRQLDRQRKKASNVEGADLIYSGDEWTVYSPHTYEASCALRNGKFPAVWCTGSTTDDHYYKQYTGNGRLYIIINNSDPAVKYQAYVKDGERRVDEFKDAHNKALSFHNLLKENPELQTCFYDSGIIKIPSDEDCDDKRALLLAQALGISVDDVENDGNNYYQIYDETVDAGPFWVLTDEEAFWLAVDIEADELISWFPNDPEIISENDYWLPIILESSQVMIDRLTNKESIKEVNRLKSDGNREGLAVYCIENDLIDYYQASRIYVEHEGASSVICEDRGEIISLNDIYTAYEDIWY